LIGLQLEILPLPVDLLFRIMTGVCIRVSMDTGTILSRIGFSIDTDSFLGTSVFPDVDVAYRYVALLYPSTACLRAA
jgi:hypothetical protein